RWSSRRCQPCVMARTLSRKSKHEPSSAKGYIMTTYASISTSLDGYYVGSSPSPQHPMGNSGSVLHSWFAHDRADRQQLTAENILQEDFDRLGAMIMGRDSYEHAQAAWGRGPHLKCQFSCSRI